MRSERLSAVILDTSRDSSETARMRIKSRFSGFLFSFLLFLCAAPAVLLCHFRQTGNPDALVRPGLSGFRGGNLVVSINEDPSTFNRMFVTRVSSAMVSGPLSADLFHINRRTFELEPSLASGFEADKDGRSYVIHLRRGIRFSDGSPFSADDVVFTLNAIQDPRNSSTVIDQLQIDGKFPAVSAIDAFTVRFTWPRAVGTGLRALDSIPMLPKSRLQKASGDGELAAAFGPSAAPQSIVGLGPFRLKQYERGIRVVLERNPYYWKKDKAGQALPYLDTVTFAIIPDRNAEALRFQAGELDALAAITTENFAVLRRSNAKDYVVRDLGPGLGIDLLWFNLNPGKSSSGMPLVDPEKRAIFELPAFRQAVSYALDRRGISLAVYGGLATPQYGPVSSGNTAWYNPGLISTPYNLAKARQLLQQCGLKDANGDGILEFGARARPLTIALLTTLGSAAREKTAEIIRQNLGSAGIRMNVQLLPINELAPRFARTYDYEAILLGNTPTDVVPDLQTDLWYSNGGNHFWHPEQTKPDTPWEAQIDGLTTRLVQNLDGSVRKQAFFQIQEIWVKQMPSIATVAPNFLCGWRTNIGNVEPSILVPYLLWNIDELTKRAQ
jgi:peptide/nickel transport system substrate-binding protein